MKLFIIIIILLTFRLPGLNIILNSLFLFSDLWVSKVTGIRLDGVRWPVG